MLFVPKLNERMSRFFLTTDSSRPRLFFSITFALLVGVAPFLATLFAYAVSFAVGYCLQHGWTSGAHHPHRHSLPRYLTVQVGCCIACALTAHAASLAGLPPLLLSLTTTLATSIISFIASMLWVFPESIRGSSDCDAVSKG
jgi:putative flippase GtrA